MKRSPRYRALEFEELLANVLKSEGWHVQASRSADRDADIVARRGKKTYLFLLKASSEARKDRAIPLISQGILEAQRAAANVSHRAVPIAVFASDHISESLAAQVEEFVSLNVPGVGVGVIDAGGFRHFSGHGLEILNSQGARSRVPKPVSKSVSSRNLFSDLNQWMLKILLSRDIPEALLSAPRGRYENASQLADAAGVSIMSAFRLVRDLSREGFIDQQHDLRLVRIEELMQRWLRASDYRRQEIPARWILKGDKRTFHAALRSYASKVRSDLSNSKRHGVRKPLPRICLALFAAAELLGFKFVHGIQPHLYIERLDHNVLRELGVSIETAGQEADVILRIPDSSEAVFRAAVERDSVPVADVVQVWLDVSHHPARGSAQADLVSKQVFSRLLDKGHS